MTAPGYKERCPPQLLSYRRVEYDPSSDLSQVDTPIRQLILHMIQLEPGEDPLDKPQTVKAVPVRSCPPRQLFFVIVQFTTIRHCA